MSCSQIWYLKFKSKFRKKDLLGFRGAYRDDGRQGRHSDKTAGKKTREFYFTRIDLGRKCFPVPFMRWAQIVTIAM